MDHFSPAGSRGRAARVAFHTWRGAGPEVAVVRLSRQANGAPARYGLRPARAADVPLLREWRSRPHVMRWWGPPDAEDPEEVLADPRVAMWIAELADGAGAPRPFAYAQDYSPHDWSPHPFAHLPPGSRGVDHYIGEPDLIGAGHGCALIRLHCDRLLAAGAPAIGADPHPDNARAIAAYCKAGFERTAGPLETRWGLAVLLERRR